LLAASVVMLCAFVQIEARSRSPLVPGSSVRNRTLVAANLSAFFTFGAIISFIFLGSLLMQQVLRYSPTRTGVCWLATTATSFVAAAITGTRLVAVAGVRRVLVAGFSLLAISALLLTQVPADGHFATDLLPALLLAGVAGAAGPSARVLGTPNAFHAAYWVIFAVAALGALTAAIAFPWRATRKTGPVRYRPATSRR
jgi:hypothetical protein